MQLYGACIYCGQMRTVNAKKGAGEEEINRIATLECDCNEAETERFINGRLERANVKTKELFESDIPDVALIINHSMPYFASGEINKLTVEHKDGVKATVKINSKGLISIKREKKVGRSATV